LLHFWGANVNNNKRKKERERNTNRRTGGLRSRVSLSLFLLLLLLLSRDAGNFVAGPPSPELPLPPSSLSFEFFSFRGLDPDGVLTLLLALLLLGVLEPPSLPLLLLLMREGEDVLVSVGVVGSVFVGTAAEDELVTAIAEALAESLSSKFAMMGFGGGDAVSVDGLEVALTSVRGLRLRRGELFGLF
jgi:hypothetical protein